MAVCVACNDSGKTATGYCTCPTGRRLQAQQVDKSLPAPDLIKRFADFDLVK